MLYWKLKPLIIYHFVLLTLISYSQILTEENIKDIAQKINSELRGVDVGNGVFVRSCHSLGRTIIYKYDLSDNTILPNNLRAEVILNYKANGFAKTCYRNKIDVDLYYYQNNKLKRTVNISWEELSEFYDMLGEYLSIKGHPKAKGVNMKLQAPVGWEVSEGARPNIVKKFIKSDFIYLILIKDNSMFVSRKEAKEFFSDEEFVKEFIKSNLHPLTDYKIVSKQTITLDNYPALEFIVAGYAEQMGNKTDYILKSWVILFEDKIVFLQGMSADSKKLEEIERMFDLITNSVIFPEQYE